MSAPPPDVPPRAPGGSPRWARRLLGLALALLTLNGGSALALRLLEARGLRFEPIQARELTQGQLSAVSSLIRQENRYIGVSEALGWALVPSGSAGLYHASARGLREPEPAGLLDGERRVLAFGDSYTHGDEVSDGESWPARLSEEPDLAVWNYGVPGFGPDQAYLRWRAEGRALGPAMVVLGLLMVDLPRTLTRFHPYLLPGSSLAMGKPRFTIQGGALVELPNPLPTLRDYEALVASTEATLARIGEGDAFFASLPHAGPLDAFAAVRLTRLAGWSAGRGPDRRAALERQGFEITTLILRRWRAEAAEVGQSFVVALLPGPDDPGAVDRGQVPSFAPLAAWLEVEQIPSFNVEAAVRGVPAEARFLAGGHYTAGVNQAVAARIAEGLRATP